MHRGQNAAGALNRTPELFGSAPANAQALPSELIAINKARVCAGETPGWWEHAVEEVRLDGVLETDILIHRVTARDSVQPGFWIRLQHQNEQLYENVLTTAGAQAPLIVWTVRVNERSLDRVWVSSTKDGRTWVPYCVKTDDRIRISATVAGVAPLAHFTNGGRIRLRAEIAIGGEMPDFRPFDDRCNTVRTASATIGPGPVIPTLLIGPGSIFAATFPNPNYFIIPKTLVVAVVGGAPTIFFHGVSTAGAIDAGGEPIVPGLVPNIVYPVDRLEKAALSKPLAGLATVSIRFGNYD